MFLVYIAAGISSRFGGKPKLLSKIGPNDETLIEVSMNQALSCKYITNIHFLVNKNNFDEIKDYLKDSFKNIPITYSLQDIPENRAKPWGTADAIASLKPYISKSFILCNSDDLYGKKVFENLINDQFNLVIAYKLGNTLPEEGKVNRGIIDVNKNYVVEEILEKINIKKSDFSNIQLNDTLVSVNLFKFNNNIFDILNGKVEAFKEKYFNDHSKEALLPEFLNEMIKKDNFEMLCQVSNNQCLGVTFPEDVENLKSKLSSI